MKLLPFAPSILAVSLLAASAPFAARGAEPDGAPAFEILHAQAQYWTNRGRGDLAAGALRRILDSDPDNPRALYEIGLLLVGEGDITSARTFESRLRRQEHTLALATQLRREIDNAEVDRSLLNEARRRAAEGEAEVALGLYEQLFSGREIGGRLAVEYYETLAGVEERWGEAADGLRGHFSGQSSNARVRLALARVLSYREETRREALFHLAALLDDSAFREDAMVSMRNTLLWLNAGADDQAYYERYLSLDADEAVAEKLALALNPKVIDAFTAARIEAFKALNQNQLSVAAQRFADLLEQRSNDAESLGGLGLVHLRQQRFADAENYLSRAIRADASTRTSFGTALQEARFWGGYRAANQLIGQRDLAAAERRLAQLEPRTDAQRAQVHVLRASIASASGRADVAIAESRRALELDGGQEAAAVILLDALSARGDRTDLEAQLTALERRASRGELRGDASRAAIRRARARLAVQRGDVDAAAAAYEQALAASGDDAWLRLEYARLLLGQDRRREAEAIVAPLSRRDADRDARHALALYYDQTGDWDRSLALVERIPTAERSAAIDELAGLVRIKRDLSLALQRAEMGDRNTAISNVMAMQQSGPDVPQKTMLLADAMLKLGLNEQAGLMVNRAMAADSDLDTERQVQYARILGEAGELSSAYRLMTDLMLRRNELDAGQRSAMAQVYDDILLRASRRAMENGEYELALSYLEPVHRANPLNGTALRHLGEVYQRRGDFLTAQKFYERAMSVDTSDLWAVKGAVGAALDAEDIDSASRLLEVALSRFPDHPDVYTLISRTAHSAKDLDMAIEAMERARELRRNSDLPVVDEPYQVPSDPGDRLPRISPDNPFRAEAEPPARAVLASAAPSRPARRAWHDGWSLVPVAQREAAEQSAAAPAATWETPAGGVDLDQAIRAEIEATRQALASSRPAAAAPDQATVAGLPGALAFSTVERLVQILAADGDHDQVASVLAGVLAGESLPAETRQRALDLLYPSAIVLAEDALGAGRPEAAFEHVRPVLNDPRAAGDVRLMKVIAAYSRAVGQTDRAAAMYAQALDLRPDDESLRLDAIGLKLEQDDLAGANALANAGLERNPDSPRLHLTVGRIAKALGDLDSAMEHFLLANESRSVDVVPATSAPSAPLAAAPALPPAPSRSLQTLPERSAPPAAAPVAAAPRLELLTFDGVPVGDPLVMDSEPLGRRLRVAAAEPTPRSADTQMDIRERLRNLGREGPAGRERASAPRQGVLRETLDSELETLRAEASPFFSQSLGFRYRSGEEGLSKLTEFRAPFELDFNPFAGRLKMLIEPVYLTSGTFGEDPDKIRRFGTFALIDEDARFAPTSDDAGGVGITFGYTTGMLTFDVGTTPLDFEILNLVGGINLAHEFDNGFDIGFDLSRRAVTESLLSYAGVEDPLTGLSYGGITNNEATLSVGQSFEGFSVYADGWYGINVGDNVDDNEHFGGDFGFTVDLLRRQGRALSAGFNTTYFSYDDNLRFFTLGHGGYFSPQRFFSSSIPVDYELTSGNLQVRFGGAISVQHFSEDAAFYFPNRLDLQEELFDFEAEQSVIHDGQTQTDLGFRASGEMIYRLTPRLQFRGYVGVERAADWTESLGMITVQYRPGL